MKKKIDKLLTYKMLDTFLIIKNYIKNEKKCNYELYLTELLNNSTFFMNKTKNQLFFNPTSQYDKECDAITDEYKIDFKLLIGTSMARAKKMTSETIYIQDNGWIVYGAPISDDVYKASRIMQNLRTYTYDDLIALRKRDKEEIYGNYLATDIRDLIEVMECRKNLLLFYPFIMGYVRNISFDKMIKVINDAFEHDMSNILKYRNDTVIDCETFISTIFDDKLLVYLVTGECKIVFEDCIDLNKSKTYTLLLSKYKPLL